MTVLFTIEALNAAGSAETLRFSDGKYIDGDGNVYGQYIADAPEISVIANDGGLFTLFGGNSVGDIALNNIDGSLSYLADFAVDGRPAKIYFFDGNTAILRFSGSIGRMVAPPGQIVFSLKAFQETLTNKHPMAVYAGSNTLPEGIEGTIDTLKGKEKPKVFGRCKNITPDLVNESLLIYQVSSRDDCVITAVFDDGVRLSNYQTNGAHSAGVSVIAIDKGVGDIPAGARILFANHDAFYTVQAGLSAGFITLTAPLAVTVPDNIFIEVVNFYTDTADLQFTDYFVDGRHSKGDTAINVTVGVGAINVGDQLIFNSHLTIYTVQTALVDGIVVIDNGLLDDISDRDVVHVLGNKAPVLWGSFQGLFRLSARPYGAVTCHAVSVHSNGTIHKAGDVFKLVATEASLLVDSAGVAEFNSAGTIGLHVTGSTTTGELLNKVTKSIAGYYHFIGSIIYLNLFTAPSSTPDFVLYDYQIDTIDISAFGLGSNGNVLHGIHCLYDRIETVQDAIDGNAPSAWQQRLKLQYLETTEIDDVVKDRHLLSGLLEIESLLCWLSQVNNLIARLLPIIKVRRDVVAITLDKDQVYDFFISCTIKAITPRSDYNNGRNLVLIGFKIDDKANQVILYLYG